MNHLGRISMKNPETIVINFTENPSSIKPAKIALQNAALCVNPQQEGPILYIPLPKSSRERREQITLSAKKIFNDYKKRLDTVNLNFLLKNLIINFGSFPVSKFFNIFLYYLKKVIFGDNTQKKELLKIEFLVKIFKNYMRKELLNYLFAL